MHLTKQGNIYSNAMLLLVIICFSLIDVICIVTFMLCLGSYDKKINGYFTYLT